MKKIDACAILDIRLEHLNDCIKKEIIKVDSKGKPIDESVLQYSRELQERREMKKPEWIKRNEF